MAFPPCAPPAASVGDAVIDVSWFCTERSAPDAWHASNAVRQGVTSTDSKATAWRRYGQAVEIGWRWWRFVPKSARHQRPGMHFRHRREQGRGVMQRLTCGCAHAACGGCWSRRNIRTAPWTASGAVSVPDRAVNLAYERSLAGNRRARWLGYRLHQAVVGAAF